MKFRKLVMLAGVAMVFACVAPAFADSWGPPTEFDATSENHRFVAHITPATKESKKPQLDVFAVNGKERTKLWSADLSNSTSPVSARMTDTGDYAVTLDNYFGVGKGDDVVAFYGKQGQIKKYSLEEIFPELEGDFLAANRVMSVSTASRWWNEDSVDFFDADEKTMYFCIWVDWAKRWIAWNVEDGKRVAPSTRLTGRWDAKARSAALAHIKSGDNYIGDYKSLGRLKHPEDRVLIEELLKNSDFNTGSISRTGTGGSSFTYCASSNWRHDADRILAIWNGLAKDDNDRDGRDKYYLLGVVNMTVAFPEPPRKNEGNLCVYLIPSNIDQTHWDGKQPDQYLKADLAYNFPVDFTGGAIKDGALGRTVNCRIDGVTPGQYWIKAVWNKKSPDADEKSNVLVKPLPGDYVSTNSPAVSVAAGKVIEGVHIDCTELVAARSGGAGSP